MRAITALADRLAEPRGAAVVVRELHVPTAALLLRLAQLDRARQVVSSIPAGLDRDDPAVSELRRTLRALWEVRADRALAPLRVLGEPEWWARGPFLVSGELGAMTLERWIAARVLSTGGGHVELALGELPTGGAGGPPEARHERVASAAWAEYAPAVAAEVLAAGDFLEIGLYGTPARRVARLHPREDPADALPVLEPDPRRYERSAGPEPLSIVHVEPGAG